MELTGKAKIEFEKWLNQYSGMKFSERSLFYINKQLTDSMKWGVYQDFFDSVGIDIDIQPVHNYAADKYTETAYYLVNVVEFNNKTIIDSIARDTRPEARTAAIQKADILYNDR